MNEDTLISFGPDDGPQTALVLGHVPKAKFISLWKEDWEGEPPTPAEVRYGYGTPPEDDKSEWVIDQDPAAVPITWFTW